MSTPSKTPAFGPLLVQLIVYALFLLAYFFLVLQFLGDWLKRVAEHDRVEYAAAALGLIVAQGIALELLTSLLLRVARRRSR